ncbi:MAG TPA: Uma2 family endonuclease [Methylobacterium sp.]|jgi:Uma2 family endonuclease|uniref:Uma2 family endonuclease n=1 Tax=Methylorubrum sp. B1-46 TaxID=2897334 RepID=UPI001E48E336|nr:Uma2 family endonuclease [Methylorubrum sp. B1-46]UGB27938.1 Uma2 family endonuclease [Methylorubrum sp. B1-46]HEV2544303.1 Uma2 family endonuclease [Methylobacterium sp.]
MAVPARRDTRMRVAEYREWAATRPDDERWELIEGVPVMMSPAKGQHQRIVTNLVKRLDDLAERQGCGAYPGLAILSEAMDDYAPIPDVVVQCGAPPEDGYTSDALLVVEVLSPSTLVLDRGRKTEFYQTFPSLAVLLLVHQDEARVEVWRRAPDWTVQFAGPGASIDLPELGGALAVAEIYARLGL